MRKALWSVWGRGRGRGQHGRGGWPQIGASAQCPEDKAEQSSKGFEPGSDRIRWILGNHQE